MGEPTFVAGIPAGPLGTQPEQHDDLLFDDIAHRVFRAIAFVQAIEQGHATVPALAIHLCTTTAEVEAALERLERRGLVQQRC
jgi:DNA-binding MarR family transcriptional regulator